MLRKLTIAALSASLIGLGASVASAFPDGQHLVPSEFVPGTYKAVPNTPEGEPAIGYVEICADVECEVGEGLLDNAVVQGPTYFVVPEGALLVGTWDVDIYRVA